MTLSPVAVDCEMVQVGDTRKKSVLGRVSIVDYDLKVLFDSHCQHDEPITDFRTKYSGIRPEDLASAPTFSEVQKQAVEFLRDRIVVGHALNNDFGVLRYHPEEKFVRDTQRCHVIHEQAGFPLRQASLKKLSRVLLGLEIQVGEHCSVEDAKASMRLYRLVERQWEQELTHLRRNFRLATPHLRTQEEELTHALFVIFFSCFAIFLELISADF